MAQASREKDFASSQRKGHSISDSKGTCKMRRRWACSKYRVLATQDSRMHVDDDLVMEGGLASVEVSVFNQGVALILLEANNQCGKKHAVKLTSQRKNSA